MSNKKTFLPDKIFTGETWLSDHALIIENDIIHSVIPLSSLDSKENIERFPGCIFAPAFIDLQIYGAEGKLFSVYPEVDSLSKLVEHCKKGGTALCLPTVATNKKEIFYESIDAVRKYWTSGCSGILGLHIEGPWINPKKRGAHIEELIHKPEENEVKELLEYGRGVIKMITLAPEVCSKKIIEFILSYDIIISAGHSNATYSEAMQSFEHGISAVTHLYNAMSPLHHREPGLVGATLDHLSVMASIIPDGHHVDYSAIRIAKKIMGGRLFTITDAVTETDEGYYRHQIADDKYEAAGILSGSALTMNKALKNIVNHAGVELGEALRMCSLYPARVMGIDHEVGKIEKGYKANLVVMDHKMNTKPLF